MSESEIPTAVSTEPPTLTIKDTDPMMERGKYSFFALHANGDPAKPLFTICNTEPGRVSEMVQRIARAFRDLVAMSPEFLDALTKNGFEVRAFGEVVTPPPKK